MNLLADPFISVHFPCRTKGTLTLPDVLARLSEDDILSFDALQVHQQQAWFCFLVQLAAITLARTQLDELSADSVDWQRALRELTPEYGADEPWRLVVEDLEKPAFMQSPVPEKKLEEFRSIGSNADSLDILITSKNHDVKTCRIMNPDHEHWVYALVCLQTLQGFSGRGNYGISRMNRGYGSRPWVGLTQGDSWGERFRRDVSVVSNSRGSLCESHGYSEEGAALVWLIPWDGESSISHRELDPSFIEICRRIRLVFQEGALQAFFRSTPNARIAAKELNGNMGDAWTPVRRDKNAALTLSRSGFAYRRVHELLLGGEYQPAPCQIVQNDDVDNSLIFKGVAMVRGQGVTEGFHSRTVPIPGSVRMMLTRKAERDRLRELSLERIEAVADLQKKAFKPAILSLIQGAPQRPDGRDERHGKWTMALEHAVDALFFPSLWQDCNKPRETAEKQWARLLRDMAIGFFEEATRSIPLPCAERYRILAKSESRLLAGLKKTFPELEH